MMSYLNELARKPAAVLVTGAALTLLALLLLFPAQGLEIDEGATLLCPVGHVAVDPANLAAGISTDRVMQTPRGARACIDAGHAEAAG